MSEGPSAATSSPYRPKDPSQGLADYEQEAIVALKNAHPSYGPAQVRAQLKRFRGWRISLKAIKRVFAAHGFETVHRGSKPQGPEPIRFEAPHRNALWQLDFAEFRMVDKASWEVLLSKELNLSLSFNVLQTINRPNLGGKEADLDYSAVMLWSF